MSVREDEHRADRGEKDRATRADRPRPRAFVCVCVCV